MSDLARPGPSPLPTLRDLPCRFALTAGLSSIGDTRLVVLGGLAELCAGAISMGLGGCEPGVRSWRLRVLIPLCPAVLASKAELDHYHYLLKQTHDRVMRSCAGEMEREVHAVLGPLGVHENISRLLADNLRNVESGEDSDSGYGQSTEGVERPQERPARSNSPPAQAPSGGGILSGLLGGNKKADAEEGGLKWSDSVGLTAFLLKFGEGLGESMGNRVANGVRLTQAMTEEVLVSRLWISAFTIGMSYFVGGLIPLLPYLFVKTSTEGLIVSTAVTAVILVIFGIFKTHFTGATGGLGGYAWGAFSTMAVGLLAAGAAFLLVRLLEVHE